MKNASGAYRTSEAARRNGISASALRQWERHVRRFREVDGVKPSGIRTALDGHAGTVSATGASVATLR
jgi:hypothetical protein